MHEALLFLFAPMVFSYVNKHSFVASVKDVYIHTYSHSAFFIFCYGFASLLTK